MRYQADRPFADGYLTQQQIVMAQAYCPSKELAFELVALCANRHTRLHEDIGD